MRFAVVLVALLAPALSAQSPPEDSTEYVSTFEQGEGTDVVMVFVTSQDCYWSGTPAVQDAVRRAKTLLQARAEAEGKRFSAVGVVKNYDWEEGIAFLSQFGYFDEVIAGRSWFNTGVVEHCHTQANCDPSTPMVRVFEREVTNEDLPDGRFRRVFGPRSYLVTVTNGRPAEESPGGIAAWVAAGAPLDKAWVSN